MDTAGNRDVVRRLYTLINEGRVEQVADLIAPDHQEHDPLPGQGSGREGAVDRFSMITTGLAPHFTVEDLIAEGRPSRCPLDERRHTCRRLRRHPSDRSTVHHRRHRHLPRRGRTVVRTLACDRPARDAWAATAAAARSPKGLGLLRRPLTRGRRPRAPWRRSTPSSKQRLARGSRSRHLGGAALRPAGHGEHDDLTIGADG
jgi:hypothetical protein